MDPFYDPARTYESNYADGPFGAFAAPPQHALGARHPHPAERFVGVPVGVPFGIPAGPLLNARFVAAAFAHGFDLCVYKTVRSRAHPCHPFPNVLAVHVEGDLTPERAGERLTADQRFDQPLSISNSFGVPSRHPDVWQPDMARAVAGAGAGQVLVGGFQATRDAGSSLAADAARTARLVVETGAPVIELNLSCPNEGTSELLCFDTAEVVRLVAAIKAEVGDVPLLVKLASFADDAALTGLVAATAEFVAGYSAINTISAQLVNDEGSPALPGPGRNISGVCGAAIREAALDMTRRLAAIRTRRDGDFTIVGVGGISSAADYLASREAGADAVMSATGAMWNPALAAEVRAAVRP